MLRRLSNSRLATAPPILAALLLTLFASSAGARPPFFAVPVPAGSTLRRDMFAVVDSRRPTQPWETPRVDPLNSLVGRCYVFDRAKGDVADDDGLFRPMGPSLGVLSISGRHIGRRPNGDTVIPHHLIAYEGGPDTLVFRTSPLANGDSPPRTVRRYSLVCYLNLYDPLPDVLLLRTTKSDALNLAPDWDNLLLIDIIPGPGGSPGQRGGSRLLSGLPFTGSPMLTTTQEQALFKAQAAALGSLTSPRAPRHRVAPPHPAAPEREASPQTVPPADAPGR